MKYLNLSFIWPWVGPEGGFMAKYGQYGVLVGTGIALPVYPPGPPQLHHPGYTPVQHGESCSGVPWPYPGLNMAVGLKSVAQLT